MNHCAIICIGVILFLGFLGFFLFLVLMGGESQYISLFGVSGESLVATFGVAFLGFCTWVLKDEVTQDEFQNSLNKFLYLLIFGGVISTLVENTIPYSDEYPLLYGIPIWVIFSTYIAIRTLARFANQRRDSLKMPEFDVSLS